MFGTLLFDRNKRSKFILKEGFNLPYALANRRKCNAYITKDGEMTPSYTFNLPQGGNVTLAESQIFTPSYGGFLNNYQVNSNMVTYQPIDFDNNVASLYGYRQDGYDTRPKGGIKTCTESGLMGVNRWCGCQSLSTTGTTETSSKRLVGGVNPRTLISPNIIPPIMDIDEWGTDNYTIHSATNNHKSSDLWLSGYTTLGDCKCKGTCNCQPLIKENFNKDVTRPQILQNSSISKIPEKSMYTSITNGDDLLFLEQIKEAKNTKNYITGDEPSMIYDPRMIGYSDSKRGYIDKLLGQPKFYYDDINAARASNYITRNKIDIYSFGESTGRLRHPKEMCGDNNQLAVEEFHNSTLQHRSDIMQSLMNKRNAEMWQLKEFPIYTGGQRMLGGTSKI